MNGPTWESIEPPQPHAIRGMGWFRLLFRGSVLAVLVFGGLILKLLLRAIEYPIFRQRRPFTPYITQAVCKAAFPILGIPFQVSGTPMTGPGAVVANHSSWLDIFALNAGQRVYFVSKAEVARWPGIGWLARATGTVFIRRERREAQAQTRLFQSRLEAGHKLLFFPEGTSTDGRRVLPFKPTLFQAFLAEGLRDTLQIQPVSVIYHAPQAEDARFYGWWGDMDFGPHLMSMLAARRQGRIEVLYHPPVPVRGFDNRKDLSARLHTDVHDGVMTRL